MWIREEASAEEKLVRMYSGSVQIGSNQGLL